MYREILSLSVTHAFPGVYVHTWLPYRFACPSIHIDTASFVYTSLYTNTPGPKNAHIFSMRTAMLT